MNPLAWIRGLFAARPPARPAGVPVERFQALRAQYAGLKARYDAAQTTDDNRRHWSHADGLSAAAANSHGVRRTLRMRSRYEADNSAYCGGVIRTYANDLVGTGPTLQILEDDDPAALPGAPTPGERVEKAFAAWCKASGFAWKWHTLAQARCRDGEAFAVMVTNPALADPVKLDLALVEADRVTWPWGLPVGPPSPERGAGVLFALQWDGINYDDAGNPMSYLILHHHPGDFFQTFPQAYDTVPARHVLHWFRCDRPGQLRGVPELTPSLPLFAQLRRWTLAALSAAEVAASLSVLLKTAAPPYAETDADDAAQGLVPFDTAEIDRNMMVALPDGYDATQLDAKQPPAQFDTFKRELLAEAGRPVHMPVNIVMADSSKHNFSSAKLDHFNYRDDLKVLRKFAEPLLDRAFQTWAEEAALIPGLLPLPLAAVLALPRCWYWPGWAAMDKDEAKNDTERLNNGTATLAELAAEDGQDWKDRLRQRGKELKLGAALGVPPPPSGKGGFGDGGGGGAPAAAAPSGDGHANGNGYAGALSERRSAMHAVLFPELTAYSPDQPRDDHGRFGEGGGGAAVKEKAAAPAYKPSVKISPSKARAFEGKQADVKNPLGKQEAGKIGEDIIIAHLQEQGMADARPMNLDRNNFPIDMIQDHEIIEGKAGQAGNSRGAQQWRLTIGEPGKAEKALLAGMSKEEKAAWNERKQAEIHERKERELKSLSRELGREVKAATYTVILNNDTKTADIYKFPGWHDRIGWNSAQAKAGYVRSVKYG